MSPSWNAIGMSSECHRNVEMDIECDIPPVSDLNELQVSVRDAVAIVGGAEGAGCLFISSVRHMNAALRCFFFLNCIV